MSENTGPPIRKIDKPRSLAIGKTDRLSNHRIVPPLMLLAMDVSQVVGGKQIEEFIRFHYPEYAETMNFKAMRFTIEHNTIHVEMPLTEYISESKNDQDSSEE